MKDIILKVENVSKQYRLGLVGTGTLTHDLNRWWHKVRGKEDPYLMIGEANDRSTKGTSDYVWALNDIDFEVERGEVLGIIGKNGAGKSTLLKLLSKVTTPTTGSIKYKGRIASLLEVGTGFHPELTGRENIYLNGAILGMTKKEITSKIADIIDFSGVERYIDTPVKRYSSGMYVRLAFAVAAHLDSDILIVDEVLAVGDAEFQKKCMGKMKDISTGQGRTVIFVSHNLAAVRKLCNRGIFLQYGKISFEGKIEDTLDAYSRSNPNINNVIASNHQLFSIDRDKYAGNLVFSQLRLQDNPVPFNSPIKFYIKLKSSKNSIKKNVCFGIAIKDKEDNIIVHIANSLLDVYFDHSNDDVEYSFEITNNLLPNTYSIDLFIGADNETQDYLIDVAKIEILEGCNLNHCSRIGMLGAVMPEKIIINVN